MIFCADVMKRFYQAGCRLFGVFLIFGMVHAARALDHMVTQTVPLVAGWNAVWLEVEPTDGDGNQLTPEEVFDNPAIESIASPRPLFGTAEYFSDAPGSISTFNEDGWELWNRTDAPGASNLVSIFGNRPYLIKVTTGTGTFGVQVTGKVRFFRPTWTPDRYNLVGFALDGTRSFSAFFGPSGSKHPANKIFKLSPDGNWIPVSASETMISHQAYWVFSNGPSNFMGPVGFDFDHSRVGVLNFAGPMDTVKVGPSNPPMDLDLKELVFTNLSSVVAVPEMDLLAVTPGLGSLALFVVNPSATERAFLRGNQVDSSTGVGSTPLGKQILSEKTGIITLGAQRNWTTGQPVKKNLYRIRTSAIGASFYLPVTASLNNLELSGESGPITPASALVGLWVGEVLVDASTSIVEDGAPVRQTAVPVPARIIIHNDGTTVRLLTQVTHMETKTADAGVAPTPVLVVDPTRIPFFEGVQFRRGKRVGVRIESVAFDMPRKMDAVSQSAILNDPAYPGLTAAGLPAFLVSRGTRPPSLREVYHLSLNLTGTIGAGGSLSTVAGSLSLDPFHRSNPFRHPFHRDHTKGPAIVRELKIDFDPNQSTSDRLTGSYTEVIKGLITSNLTMVGRVEFHRVSSVATIDSTP
jgi:hypothetical protein